MRIEAKIACLAVALLTASGALAQRPYRERSELDPRQSTERDRAGVFDYYVLSLSWSPGYCTSLNPGRRDPQCSGRFGFVLHGLWPEFERGWPQDCQSPDRGFVPRPVAERMRDIMPSDKLIFHAYRKHGTCSGLGVDGYFALARRLFEKVRIPPRFQNLSEERLTIAPSELIGEFLASNPELTADMIAVHCAGPGERLREVRICFDRDGNFRSCGKNENQSKLCSAARIYVPPLRSHTSAPPGRDGDLMLPGPRE